MTEVLETLSFALCCENLSLLLLTAAAVAAGFRRSRCEIFELGGSLVNDALLDGSEDGVSHLVLGE